MNSNTARWPNRLIGIAWSAALALALPHACDAQVGREECDLVLTSCPEQFHGDTIFVPEKVTALSAKIHVCEPTHVKEGVAGRGGTPSIVIVIDHTGSMTGISTNDVPHDQWGSRFTVTRQLLDTIATRWPAAEVSLVVFREHLYFDPTTDEYFAQYFRRFPTVVDRERDQAYLPFVTLNQTYGGVRGIDMLKDILVTDTVQSINGRGEPWRYVDLKYEPNFETVGLTNINGAFDAARLALQEATHPREHQFVIFLSDGEPRGDNQAGRSPTDFIRGEDLPTTFTVFFTSNREGPESIEQMTENIRNNGYSLSNRYSEVWALETSHERLLNLLMDQVLQTILTVTVGVPQQIVVNGSHTSTTFRDSSFIFGDHFLLEEDLTNITFTITYQMTDVESGQQRDTTHEVSFYVKRVPTAAPTDGVEIVCSPARGLELYYQGGRVDRVFDHMQELEIRLSSPEATGSYVEVEVTTVAGSHRDREEVILQREDLYYSGTFPRETSSEARQEDGTLQHLPVDSIVVVYRNPDDPDDALRIAVPVDLGKTVTAASAAYYDRDADGFIDSIHVMMDGEISPEVLTGLTQHVVLPPHRGFELIRAAVTPEGIGLAVREDRAEGPHTAVDSRDRLVFREGPVAEGVKVGAADIPIADRLAPVIVSARLHPGIDGLDTLHIAFSEPVNPVNHSSPFHFKDTKGTPYTVVLGRLAHDGDRGSFLVEQVGGVAAPSPGDTVWINPEGFVTDVVTEGNVQSNPRNRRVRLMVQEVPFAIVPRVANSPLSPEAPPVPDFILRLPGITERTGMIIMAEPDRPVPANIRLEAVLAIYDIVDNPVLRERPMPYDPQTGRLYFVWSGINDRGRRVATGTYLAVIRLRNPQETQMIRIGVKW